MPIFKVTAEGPGAFDYLIIFDFLIVTSAKHTLLNESLNKCNKDLNICMFDYDFKKKKCFYSIEEHISLPFSKYFVFFIER